MKKTKKFRNEKNIGMELSKQFNISESTVFNYLRVKNLCDPGLTMLYDEEISMQVATYLTKVPKGMSVTYISILEKPLSIRILL